MVFLIFSYFMKKPASLSLVGRLSPKKIPTTGLHGERLSSYVEIVNYLLCTYATDDIMAWAIMKMKFSMQAPEVSVKLYAKRLYPKALRYGIVYEENVSCRRLSKA